MNMQVFIRLCLFLLVVPVSAGFAQHGNKSMLQARIRAVIDSAHAKVGVGIAGLDFNENLSISGIQHFPMQSVFKFPLAIAVLEQIDAGKLSPGQKVSIRRKSLDTATWSPMLKEFPDRDTSIALSELLRYAVSKSDNNACDILFGLVGGTAVVNNYIRSIRITGMAVKATEAQMKTAWPVQYTNWCEPVAMIKLLSMFYNGKLLSKNINAFVMTLMTESENSPKRIKGYLPSNAVVAHKTGTSDTNEQGMKAATNDVGIITLPDGRHYAMAVFVSDYYGGVEKGERVIATISKLVWDYFQGR